MCECEFISDDVTELVYCGAISLFEATHLIIKLSVQVSLFHCFTFWCKASLSESACIRKKRESVCDVAGREQLERADAPPGSFCPSLHSTGVVLHTSVNPSFSPPSFSSLLPSIHPKLYLAQSFTL